MSNETFETGKKRGGERKGRREENRGRKTERDTETHRQRDREKVGSFSLRKKRFFRFFTFLVFKRLHMGV